MNMADVTGMETRPFDVIDFDNYQDGGSGKKFSVPDEGKYAATAPIFKSDGTDVISPTNSFGHTAAGYLKVSIDGLKLITPGSPDGYLVRFQELSSKKYVNREGSQVIDFLRACGIAARPKTEDELRTAVLMASGRGLQVVTVWEAYNKDAKETTTGQDNFPKDKVDPNKTQPWIVDEFDSTKRWFANAKVKYTISAIAKA